MKPEILLEIILRALPYPNQIRDIKMEDNSIRFSWRAQKFRVSTLMDVETVGDGVLIGDDASILMESLIKRESIA